MIETTTARSTAAGLNHGGSIARGTPGAHRLTQDFLKPLFLSLWKRRPAGVHVVVRKEDGMSAIRVY